VALALNSVFPNPEQPRKNFAEDSLRALGANIREKGLLQPITVTPRDGGYMIIAGERRWRAHGLAGLETVDAIVIEADEDRIDDLALLENINREDLNPIEEATAFKRMMDKGVTREALCATLGYPPSHAWRIDQRLSLLNLTLEHRELVVTGDLGHSEAYEMSRLNSAGQAELFRRLKSGGPMSYNKLRSLVDGLLSASNQGALLELQHLNAEEERTVMGLEAALAGAEKFIGTVIKEKRLAHLAKVAFHTNVTVERLDLLIKNLQKVRKEVHKGSGVKQALEVA
jgi:ParB family chromosome partitioning protein